jgi:predicted phage baseplate assembly protein
MSAPWWGKEASIAERSHDVPATAAPQTGLSLCDDSREAVLEELNGLTESFTPEWTNRSTGDAGTALLKLFSEELEPVLERLNVLPENAFIQFLITAGVQMQPPTPAEALVQFAVADGATQQIPIPQGFQMSAPAAGGGDPVVFETSRSISAVPGTLKEIYAFEHGFYRSIDPTTEDVAFLPFGKRPQPGLALFLGISASPDVDMGRQLSIGFDMQGPSGLPAPVSTGGATPLPAPLAPYLEWSILDGASFQPAKILQDETNGLLSSGIVSLEIPAEWKPGIPSGAADTKPLFWLRLQLVYGTYARPPELLSVKLNMARVIAVRTIYDEVLAPVANTRGSAMRLSQTPVLPGSLILEVDDTADLSFKGSSPLSLASSATTQRASAGTIDLTWKEVDDLSMFSSDDKVYVLDSASGLVHFGDGVHGKVLPPGFRNVHARSYQVGGGQAGAVAAGKISNLINSIPFLTGVKNPRPATGGMDAETPRQAAQRGPEELRAHGRVVAPADYEVLALRATGAQVARALAVSGFHPSFPGRPIPGVVCVFVIPQERGIGAPIADEDALRAVSDYLSTTVAPAGVEIVAAAPRFHRVRVIVSVVVRPGANPSEIVADVQDLINKYLDPIEGGEDGNGWPFGGTLSYVSLVRRILTTFTDITAVPNLQFVVDGIRKGNCTDFPITANSLVWPSSHEVFVLAPGEEP